MDPEISPTGNVDLHGVGKFAFLTSAEGRVFSRYDIIVKLSVVISVM